MRERVRFAVVREDAELEAHLVARFGARAALVVAAGGCTALALASRYPALQVTAFDVSQAQLDHLRDKARAVQTGDLAALNVEDASATGLNQRGQFEGLFRALRGFVEEFVAPRAEIEALFAGPDIAASASSIAGRPRPTGRRRSPPASTNPSSTPCSAPRPRSTPRPDRTPAISSAPSSGGSAGPTRRGTPSSSTSSSATTSPPTRRPTSAPAALLRVEVVLGALPGVPDLERFDLYSLSNVFDWFEDAEVARWGAALAARAPPGSVVLVRKLNNDRDVRRFFVPAFRFDDALGAALLERERSLFYDRVVVGFRV